MHQVVDIEQDTTNEQDITQIEPMGTKEKFWYRDVNGDLCLFKKGRPGTRENAAEFVASKLAKMLDLPCADYDLAKYGDVLGVRCKSIIGEGELIHGNEIMHRQIIGYPRHETEQRRYITLYTLENALKVNSKEDLRHYYECMENSNPVSAKWVFIGYLIFDAWIGNTDRHDENWAWIIDDEENRLVEYLAPTFDHASSLGREIPEEEKRRRLESKDERFSVRAYCEKAKTPLYVDGRRSKTFDLVDYLLEFDQNGSRYWIDKAISSNIEGIRGIFRNIPDDFMSEIDK